MTVISCEHLRQLAEIDEVILPPGFDPLLKYDKWGNVILDSGRRLKGPLFSQENVQKVLRKANFLLLFDK